MSTVINLADARARGIALPDDDPVAQDILDEQESWLFHRIGQLTAERTETLYVGLSVSGRLALQRYTDAVVVVDGGMTVDADHFRLIAKGSEIVRSYASPSRWWTGPYVLPTYTPNDEADVRRVLYALTVLAVEPEATLDSETLGDYSYTTGKGTQSVPARRAALASSLIPKRDPLLTLPILTRRLGYSDPVINRAEVEPA